MTAPAAARTTDDGGRVYPIPDPATGDVIELPNISSVIDVLASFHLPPWRTKMAVLGVAHRDDLIARVCAAHLLDTSKTRNAALREIVEDAINHGQTIEPGKGYLANDFGSAIHLLTEHADAGLVDILALPATVAEHCAQYLATIEGHGLDVVHSEATVYSFEHGYAGTLDRIVRFQRRDATADLFDAYDLGRGCFDLDIKTGSVHDKVAMQLAAHVNAEAIYDAESGEHRPLPDDLRRDVAFALQLTSGGAKLLPVVLNHGWPAFVGALAVQRFVATKPIGAPLVAPPAQATPPPGASPQDGAVSAAVSSESPPTAAAPIPVETPEPASPGPAAVGAPPMEPPGCNEHRDKPQPFICHKCDLIDIERGNYEELQIDARRAAALFAKHEWIVRERIAPLDQRGRDLLAAHWPPGVPTMQHGNPHTFDELTLIAKACDVVDALIGQPFPEHNDPTDPRNVRATADDIAAVVARLKCLPHDLAAHVAANVRGQVPKLTDPDARVYQSHLDALEPHLAAAETEAAPRLQRLSDLIGIAAENGVSKADLLAVVGRTDPLACTAADVAVLDMVTDACALGVVTFDDLDGFGHQSLVVDKGLPGKPSQILAAGRAAAKTLGTDTPRSAADVLGDPLLAAVAALRDDAA